MIEPQSLTPVPRAARMREGHRDARRVWAVGAAVAGAILLAFLLFANVRWQRLARHGVAVEGRVAARRQTTGKGATNTLVVDFPFDRETHTGSFQVEIGDYDRYGYGDPIRVVVDPEDGTNVRLLRFDADDANGLLLLWGAGWLVVGAAVALAFWADRDMVESQRKKLEGWDLGWMAVDRVLPAEAKQSGLYLEGHYEDAEGRTCHVGRLHLPTGFAARERLPILIDPYSDSVVALAALDKVEPA